MFILEKTLLRLSCLNHFKINFVHTYISGHNKDKKYSIPGIPSGIPGVSLPTSGNESSVRKYRQYFS